MAGLPAGLHRRRALPSPRHRLGRIEAWLDYLVELGCNGLALGPVFAARPHGYDTVDHFRIDPRLGTEADFDHLIEPCHDRGIRVLLDGVFNHVGRAFPAFQDVLAQGPASPYAAWFQLDFTARRPGRVRLRDFEGHHQLVALNHAEPAVRRLRGAGDDALAGPRRRRLAAGRRLRGAAAFWRAVLGRVRAGPSRTPGSSARSSTATTPATSRDGGLDSVTQYELWKAIWSALNDRNLFELAWALDRHNGFAGRLPAADLRRQPRRHPAGQPAHRRRGTCRTRWSCCSPWRASRPSTPATSRRSAAQGGPGGRGRRDPPGLPGRARRAGPVRLAGLPAAPGPDRPAPASPLAGPRGLGGSDVAQ